MSYFYLCPYCGCQVHQYFVNCQNCHNKITPIRSNYERDYYFNKSNELFGDDSHWEEILLKEIKCNPLFNEKIKAHKKFANTSLEPNVCTPKCPTCKSTNIKKLSTANRAAHGYAFGLFSKTARSQFYCNNCGYKW